MELHAISRLEARGVADLEISADEVRRGSLEQDYRVWLLARQDSRAIVLADTTLVGPAVDRR